MKVFEFLRLCADPFLPVLHSYVRRDICRILNERKISNPVLLDAGGRKSPYTIGVSAKVVICDKLRESAIQKKLHLGINDQIIHDLKRGRTNIEEVVFCDLAADALPGRLFDGVVSVEVIEHIVSDRRFIQNLWSMIKPGGFLYLTTPNGDYVKNEPPYYNPDHVRHYKKSELEELLKDFFGEVTVWYGIKTGKWRSAGLRSFSFKKPIKLIFSILGNLMNRIESRGLENQSYRTAHLFCLAFKK